MLLKFPTRFTRNSLLDVTFQCLPLPWLIASLFLYQLILEEGLADALQTNETVSPLVALMLWGESLEVRNTGAAVNYIGIIIVRHFYSKISTLSNFHKFSQRQLVCRALNVTSLNNQVLQYLFTWQKESTSTRPTTSTNTTSTIQY